MGNVQNSENGSASLAGLESLIRDPSMILGVSQHAIVMRNQLAAQSSTHNTLSCNPSKAKPQAIPLLISSSLEADSGRHMPDGVGPHEEIQFMEAEP